MVGKSNKKEKKLHKLWVVQDRKKSLPALINVHQQRNNPESQTNVGARIVLYFIVRQDVWYLNQRKYGKVKSVVAILGKWQENWTNEMEFYKFYRFFLC